MNYKLQDIAAFAASVWPAIQVIFDMSLAHLKRIPSLIWTMGEDSYFNPTAYAVSIGLAGVFRRLKPQSDADAQNALDFVIKHEKGHVLYTASKPYARGSDVSFYEIVETIAKKEGIRQRFLKDSDYHIFINRTLPQRYGVTYDGRSIVKFVSFVFNSIEDGRIERIMRQTDPHFVMLCRRYRGVEWERSEQKPYADVHGNPRMEIWVILNTILTLATTQLYPKGFLKEYAGTDIHETVKECIPYIWEGINAAKTRAMAENAKQVLLLLTPRILAAARTDTLTDEQKQELEELIRKILTAYANSPDGAGTSEDEEGDGTSTYESLFGTADLVVKLPDETYDKLMEKLKKDGDEGESDKPGITVVREHPLPPEEPENGDDTDAEGTGEDAPPENDGKTKENGGQPDMADEQGTNQETVAETVRQERTKAEKETQQSASEAADIANEGRLRASHTPAPVCRKETPLDPKEVKDICANFLETRRAYTVTDALPAVLNAKGKALNRKIRQSFQSREVPTIRNCESGSIDPKRLFGLAMGNTDIFCRIGVNKTFSGRAYILLDNSGSMDCDDKREKACYAAALVEEGFKGLIPFKICAFDDDRGRIIHEVIKDWDERYPASCCWNFFKKGRRGMGNEDGYDIKIATHELLKFNEQHKLLCVISDGMPGNRRLVKQAVEDARKKGIVVYAILISGSDEELDPEAERAFREMYANRDSVTCPVTELDRHLVRLFDRFSKQ